MKTVWCMALMCFSWLWAAGQSATVSTITDLLKKAESGDPEAQFRLGRAYEDGKDVAQDDESAAKWYRKAADQGNAAAQNDLGVMYRHGRGVPRDREEAARWFTKAADQCNPNGAYNLAIAHYNGDGVVTDPGLAFSWLLVARQCGNTQVKAEMDQISAGMTIRQRQTGEFRFVDYVMATPAFKPDTDKLFNEMCLLNPPLAMELCSEYGAKYGTNHNDAKAQIWCQRALAQHSEGAYVILGRLAEERRDFAEALKMYQQAVDQADPSEAVGRLGVLFLEGRGVASNTGEAYFWLYLAVKKYSQKELQPQFDRAAFLLSKQARKDQEKRAEKWRHSHEK